MQSVSDDDVRKRLLEKRRFELATNGVFKLVRCYIFWEGVPGLRARLPANEKALYSTSVFIMARLKQIKTCAYYYLRSILISPLETTHP